MNKPPKATVNVKGTAITILAHREEDYISLTDIARHRNPDRTDDLIRNWLLNRNTIEFLGIWESLNNPGFKPVEFDGFRRQAGLNSFALIHMGLPQSERLMRLNQIAIRQMQVLTDAPALKQLKG
jgi:hypothetical protein